MFFLSDRFWTWCDIMINVKISIEEKIIQNFTHVCLCKYFLYNIFLNNNHIMRFFMFINCVCVNIFCYFGIVALIRYTKGEPLTMGRLYGFASIAETIPSLFRQFLAAMRHLMTMVKVAFLLVIELGVFPLMCGWWLDVCTIQMFGKTMVHRVQFFSASPLASSLVHWVVGIVYMLQISIFVSLLRGVISCHVIWFVKLWLYCYPLFHVVCMFPMTGFT